MELRRFVNRTGVLLMIIAAAVTVMSTGQQAAEPEEKTLRHVVLVKFKDTVTAAQIAGIEQGFADLESQIDEIQDFEWGTNNSAEGLSQEFTHCFLVTFKSEADRDAYLPHAAHLKFVEQVKPVLEKVLVVDYWVK